MLRTRPYQAFSSPLKPDRTDVPGYCFQARQYPARLIRQFLHHNQMMTADPERPACYFIIINNKDFHFACFRQMFRTMQGNSLAASKTAVKTNSLPKPGSLFTMIFPFISSTSCLVMASPSPVPPNILVVEGSTCVNGQKAFKSVLLSFQCLNQN